MSFRLAGAIATDVGKVRESNQDSGFVGSALFAVADGMGGHSGGEVASSIVVEEFDKKQSVTSSDDLVDLAEEANRVVFSESDVQNLQGMGTTLVALASHSGNQVSVINIGDSRAYWLRDGYLAQVTRDHSFVGDLFYANEITEEEALHHPKRNVITRALGIEDAVDVDHFPLKVQVGDRFLLCSDGLTGEVPETDIAEVLISDTSPAEAAAELVRQALAFGGKDNVTVLVVDVVEASQEPDGELASSEMVGAAAEKSGTADSVAAETKETKEAKEAKEVEVAPEPDLTISENPVTVASALRSWRLVGFVAAVALMFMALFGFVLLSGPDEDDAPVTTLEESLTDGGDVETP